MRFSPQTWAPGTACSTQVCYEALRLCLALHDAALTVDLNGATVVLRNDANAGLSALRRGSKDSTVTNFRRSEPCA